MEIKTLIQTKLSKDTYLDICDFIEELYLADCDLLILMARKFYNLFCVFHALNQEKYKQLEIPYFHNKKIITNRALPLLENSIKDGVYKKIIIADDIIIHGRSVKEIYDQLMDLNPELDIRIMSYVRNNEENSHILQGLARSSVLPRYIVNTDEWRTLSDEIVQTFYLSGRPYISYLPYFVMDISWDTLVSRFKADDCISIQHHDMKLLDIDAFVYMGDGLNIFKNLKNCKVCGIRFYHYANIPKITAVPYCCLDDMNKAALDQVSDFLRTNYLNPRYVQKVTASSREIDMRVIELEYTFSAWMAIYTFGKYDIPVKKWERDIEEYNFSERLLSNEPLSAQNIVSYIRQFEQIMQDQNKVSAVCNTDIKKLEHHFSSLLQKYIDHYPAWAASRQNEHDIHNYVFRILGHFEYINGSLDEEKCKNEIDQKRLFGLPVSLILTQLASLLQNLPGNTNKWETNLKQAFAAVITVIDAGQATIVTRYIEEAQTTESVIYAGEQNYKYHEIVNFPAMYGLYLIEEIGIQHSSSVEEIAGLKNSFVEKYIAYMNKNSIFHFKGELENLASTNLKKEYGRFLRHSYKKYDQEPNLQYAVKIAKSLQ